MSSAINLNLDYEAVSGTLASLVGNSAKAFAQHLSVDNIDLQKVHFKDFDVQNKAQLLTEIRQYIASAQKHVEEWEDNLNPMITTAAQGFINYGSQFANTLTALRDLTGKPAGAKTADQLRLLFQGLMDKVDEEVAQLNSLKTKLHDSKVLVDDDASNLSDKNKAFADLEKMDEENLKEVKEKLAELKKELEEHTREITNKAILNNADINVVAIVLSVDHLSEYTPALGLAIETGFLIKEGLELQELLWIIDKAFEEAMQEQRFQFEVSELNEQLLGLKAASDAVAKFSTYLQHCLDAISGLQADWQAIRQPLNSFVQQLDPANPLANVPPEYMLGRASAEWEIMLAFAEQTQRISFTADKKKSLVDKSKSKAAA
ncbi:MAG: HBL/NHE enterotoxin family protein [Gammaproteobacteria bacterium]|jgi:hypothetical protein